MEKNNKKICILAFDYKPNTGGIAEHIHNIFLNISKINNETILLAPKIFGFVDNSSKIIRFSNLKFIKYISAIYYIIKYRNYSFYVDSYFPSGFLLYLVNFFIKIKYSIAVHGTEISFIGNGLNIKLKKIFKALFIDIFNKALNIFPVSNYTKNILLTSGVYNNNIFIIYNGIDIDYFQNLTINKSGFEKKYDFIKGKKVILTVSRLEDYKGIDFVIMSMIDIINKNKNIVYLIAGDGPYKSVLFDLINKFRLNSNVFLLGGIYGDEKFYLYSISDLFILNSRIIEGKPDFEGFGIVFLEAGFFKVPCIGGKSGGIIDAILDNETGILVNPTNIEEISEKINILLNNKQLSKKLSDNMYNRIVNELNWVKISKFIYEKL